MDLRTRVADLMPRVRDELAELVAIPSVADPRQFPPEECERAAQWVLDKFAELGFADARLEETADGSHGRGRVPAVLATRRHPTVLLYAHYDVQPPLDDDAWRTPPFELTEVDGRWYGRGAADCKGNIVMHLAALRALGDDVPVNLKLVVEGSEEQGTGGLEAFVAGQRRPAPRRRDPGLRHRQRRRGPARGDRQPARHGQRGRHASRRWPPRCTPGMFGGAAPDALAALVAMLATPARRRRATPRSTGLDNTRTLGGRSRTRPSSSAATPGCSTACRCSVTARVSDMLWARPAVTVLGIDCPPVVGSAAAIVPAGRGPAEPAHPARDDARGGRGGPASRTSRRAAPWGVHVTVEVEATGSPFEAATDGPAYRAMAAAMQEAYGRPMAHLGQGGSIPLCNVFADTYPDAEIILMGVEEPLALIHAPNESVDPSEISAMALTEALFLQRYAAAAT